MADWGWLAASYLGGMVTVLVVKPVVEFTLKLFGR